MQSRERNAVGRVGWCSGIRKGIREVETTHPARCYDYLFGGGSTIKKNKSDGIHCLGQASGGSVTGSCYLLKFGGSNILLDFGL